MLLHSFLSPLPHIPLLLSLECGLSQHACNLMVMRWQLHLQARVHVTHRKMWQRTKFFSSTDGVHFSYPWNLYWPCDFLWPTECEGIKDFPIIRLGLKKSFILSLSFVAKACYRMRDHVEQRLAISVEAMLDRWVCQWLASNHRHTNEPT